MPADTITHRRPDLFDETAQSSLDEYVVIVFNNEVNTWNEVILILQKATGCSADEARMETWEVHNLGKSTVHHGTQEECDRVAAIIRTIGIKVEVRSE